MLVRLYALPGPSSYDERVTAAGIAVRRMEAWDLRGSGAGAALLFRCLEGMRELGYAYAIIGGVGPAEFYQRVCGATVIEGSDPGIYGDLYREIWQRGERG